ncbi:hypothetical protein M0802_004669 [Mischocyttarus mexicanus]|nr:hypothetical protein M0802_004669 [Mischocyttarus mexicanus]
MLTRQDVIREKINDKEKRKKKEGQRENIVFPMHVPWPLRYSLTTILLDDAAWYEPSSTVYALPLLIALPSWWLSHTKRRLPECNIISSEEKRYGGSLSP